MSDCNAELRWCCNLPPVDKSLRSFDPELPYLIPFNPHSEINPRRCLSEAEKASVSHYEILFCLNCCRFDRQRKASFVSFGAKSADCESDRARYLPGRKQLSGAIGTWNKWQQ